MTTETTEQATEQTEEQRAAEAVEAEAAFAAGYAKVSGKEPEKQDPPKEEAPATATEKPAAEQEAEAKAAADAKAEADAKAATDKEWEGVPAAVRARLEKLEGVPGTIDKLAGHIGGFKRQLDVIATAKAAATRQGADVPSEATIAAAKGDSEKWKKAREDFPEWADAMDERLAAIAAQEKPVVQAAAEAPAVDIEAITSQAEERALVRMKYPDWKKTVVTPDFSGWLKGQPEEVRALSASETADDAIALLDGYAAHRKAAVESEVSRQRREKRLTGALTPQGTQVAPSTGISDEEAFERGFKSVVGKK